MPDVREEYRKALRLGERSYRDALAKGQYPYLQVLEELINHITIVREEKLGVQEIPLDAVNGTYAAGRRTAFAPNFMPLLEYTSEFAFKWSHLYDAHENEGIRDAIVCYEYMNRYYVVEGNKRVSVMKFSGSRSIAANVTRLVPARSDTKANIVYYEYLDFYKYCPVNFLVFTESGSYEGLQKLAGKKPGECWSDDEIMDLRSAFTRFQSVYLPKGGAKFKNLSVSDAFLIYMHICGYQESKNDTPEEIARKIVPVWTEFETAANDQPLEVLYQAGEAPKKNLISHFLDAVIPEKKIKIAFIYLDSPETSEWTYGHELGRLHINEALSDYFETAVYDNVTLETIQNTLEQAVQDGAEIVFATSRLFLNHCLKAAIKYPKVKFLDCTLRSYYQAVRSYDARTFEAKFLCGIIAGCLSDNNNIGYVCNMPVPVNITNLNAFALGVKTVNPGAKVHIQWTEELGADAKGYFWDHGISLISGQDMISTNRMYARDFGVYRIQDGVITNLAMPLINWGTLYDKLLLGMHSGLYAEEGRAHENQAINYWWGISSDVVDLIVSDKVPKETARLVLFLKDQIANGTLHLFSGYIESQNGVILDDINRTLTPREIMSMDWLCSNIVGHIPTIDQLTADARVHMEALPKEDLS